MFNTGHALPLNFIRTWGARRYRAKAAQVPRHLPQSRTRMWLVHNRGLVAQKARTRIGRVPEQSAVASSPWQTPRQWTVHEQAVATNTANPPASHKHDLHASTIRPCPRLVPDSGLADECPRRAQRISALSSTSRLTTSNELPNHVLV